MNNFAVFFEGGNEMGYVQRRNQNRPMMGLYQGTSGTIGVFKKKITDYIEGQVLFICRYEAPELRASVDLTYSAETFVYILVRTGAQFLP